MAASSTEYGVIGSSGVSSQERLYYEKYLAKARRIGRYLSIREFIKCLNLPYKHEPYQIRDLEHLFELFLSKQKEAVILRARGGSKTHDTMKFCLYLIYLGFEVIYFTANASQMERPKIYMKDLISRSFLKWCVADKNDLQKEKVVFAGTGRLTIINLTESKAISPRADVIVFDEERKADPDAYNNTHGIFADTNIGFTLHISKAEKATIFEDNTEYLLKEGVLENETYVMNTVLYDISFLWDKRREHYEKLKKRLPKWLWEQEFENKFVLPYGAVFQNVQYGPYPDWLMEAIEEQPLLSGVDWNPVSGHKLVSKKWTKDLLNSVVLGEIDLGQGYAVEMTMNQWNIIKEKASYGNHLNYECSGINEEYVKWVQKMKSETMFNAPEQNWHSEEWDSQGINKQRIVNYIIQRGVCIWVDEIRFPNTAKEIKDTKWDQDSERPKLLKKAASSPHYLESYLHAASEENRRDTKFTFEEWY